MIIYVLAAATATVLGLSFVISQHSRLARLAARPIVITTHVGRRRRRN